VHLDVAVVVAREDLGDEEAVGEIPAAKKKVEGGRTKNGKREKGDEEMRELQPRREPEARAAVVKLTCAHS
jgi:hypothetical protein